MFKYLRRKEERKVLEIGLDCGEPSLVFDKWRDERPTLRQFMEHGVNGLFTSSIPCITVTAWSPMLFCKAPNHLGLYGFRLIEEKL